MLLSRAVSISGSSTFGSTHVSTQQQQQQKQQCFFVGDVVRCQSPFCCFNAKKTSNKLRGSYANLALALTIL
eukprot:3250526-Amphidinium_carterae.1